MGDSWQTYYSTNGGKSQQNCKDQFGYDVFVRQVDIRANGRGYGTPETNSWLLHTIDSGKTWNAHADRDLQGAVAVSSPSANVVFVSRPTEFVSNGTLYYTTDSLQYNMVNTGNKLIRHLHFHNASTGIFHDGTTIYRTSDSLKNFNTIDFFLIKKPSKLLSAMFFIGNVAGY